MGCVLDRWRISNNHGTMGNHMSRTMQERRFMTVSAASHLDQQNESVVSLDALGGAPQHILRHRFSGGQQEQEPTGGFETKPAGRVPFGVTRLPPLRFFCFAMFKP